MKTLIENQEFEDQVTLNESEEIQGGWGSCSPNYGTVYADEDNNDNVVF